MKNRMSSALPLTCELLPRPHQALNARRERVSMWLRCLAGFGSLACVAALASICGTVNDGDALFREAQTSTHRADELDRSVVTMRPELVALEARLNVAEKVGDQPDWSDLLSIVASQIKSDVTLTQIRLEPAAAETSKKGTVVGETAQHLSMQGVAPSLSSASRFVLRLEQTGLFDRVDQVSGSRQSPDGAAVTFRLDCPLRAGASSALARGEIQ